MNLHTLEVGMTLPPIHADEISRASLALFAGASGDHNPIHIDLDVARSAGLDDVFAQGMLSMAYLARLLTSVAPQQAIHSLHARFLAVTPVHARPTCRGVVVAADVDTVTANLAVELADGTITITGTAVLSKEH